ncbi:MAG: DUF2079 domain-containing protein [Candidatus Eisenbacteria bacterium]
MSAHRARQDAAPPTTPPTASNPRRELLIVLLMAAAHVAVYQTICVTKFRYYLYRDFDLAIFVQAIHGVMHGSWFSSIRGMNWLGDHSSLILIPLAPIFALAPHPLTLLGMQTAALAAGAIPVWLLARRELPEGPLPVACAALYLLHPALGYLNLFEFHPETLAVPLLLWCVLEVRSGRSLRAGIAAGLALLAREDVALPVLGLAAVSLFAHPRRARLGLTLAALAAGSLVLSFGVLKPWLLGGQAEYGRMYARWGSSAVEIATGVLTRPHEALAAFWATPGNPDDTLLKQQMWLHLFLPIGGVALLAPIWLLPALPVFAEHLLAVRTHQHTIVFQYAALTFPFVVVATVLGLRTAVKGLAGIAGSASRAARVLGVTLVALAAATQVLFGPIVGRNIWQKSARNEAITPDAFERTLKPYRDAMVARLPMEGAVIAGFEFLSHLATRREVHSIHHVLGGKYTYSERRYPVPTDVRAILGDMSAQIPHLRFDSGTRMRAIAAEHDLRPAAAAGGTILMLAGARDPVEFFRVGAKWEHERLDLLVDEQLLFINAERLDSVVAPGGVARIASYWKRVAPANRNYLSQAWLVRGREIVLYGRARSLGYGIFPAADWPADTIVSEIYHLLIPLDMPAGPYRPVFRLVSVDAGGRQETPNVRFGNVREQMNVIGLGDITVTAPGGGAK